MIAVDEAVTVGGLLARPDVLTRGGHRISMSGGRISAVDAVAGDAATAGVIAVPALANAHDHGRGLRPLAYGAHDQPLETWFSALNVHPDVDPYLNAACAFGRMAQSGIGLVVHCHMARGSGTLVEDAVRVCRAARDVGVRLAFVVPMRDRARLGYFPDEAVLRRLPERERAAIEKRWLGPVLPVREQIAVADEIAARCEGGLIEVLYGPAAPHWCTNEMLERVADASAAGGRRVHMHCLETRYQREFADAAFPGGLFPYLRDIGLLSGRLTLAHGVYLRREEMDLIAQADATVSLNTCSNLRLRSGIAPARELAERGVRLAVGIDALGLDDVEDGLRELRLTYLLHAGIGFEPGLTREKLLRSAMGDGARAVTGRDGHGRIEAGAPADFALLDYAEMSRDVMDGVTPELDVVLSRATARHVHGLVVNGASVVADGALRGIDLAAVERELTGEAQRFAADYRRAKPHLEALQAALRGCYAAGLHREPGAAGETGGAESACAVS